MSYGLTRNIAVVWVFQSSPLRRRGMWRPVARSSHTAGQERRRSRWELFSGRVGVRSQYLLCHCCRIGGAGFSVLCLWRGLSNTSWGAVSLGNEVTLFERGAFFINPLRSGGTSATVSGSKSPFRCWWGHGALTPPFAWFKALVFV